MKGLKTVKKVVFTTVGVLYFAFALCMTILLLNRNDYNVTQFENTSLIIITDDVSIEGYEKGDLVIVESQRVSNLQKGEILFTYRLDSNKTAHVEIGKIGEVYPDEESISFENGDTYSLKFIAGKPTKVIHGIGSVLSIITSQWGFLFIVLLPCFLIFIYEIYALIIEIKYGANEE